MITSWIIGERSLIDGKEEFTLECPSRSQYQCSISVPQSSTKRISTLCGEFVQRFLFRVIDKVNRHHSSSLF